MKFSYNWLKEIAKFKEAPETLADILTLRAFEVEGVVKLGSDWQMNVALLPNRIPDASGHLGMAREIAAITKGAFNEPKLKTGLKAGAAKKYLNVKIEDKNDCSRYIGVVMDGVKVGESPKWMKERLELCGVQSINNLVDAANYVMLETGQPLHVFDWLALGGKGNQKQIMVRRAKKGEKMMALDDKEYALSPDVLVIADANKPLAVAGIKGGKESGVSAETTAIVLEAANFNSSAIRRASKLLNLKTDASYRFEHDLDPNLAERAVRRLADVIMQLAGGRVKGAIDAYPAKVSPKKIMLRLDYAARLIGEELPLAFFQKTFKALGMKVMLRSKTQMIIEVPTVRRDISIEEDLIEEAGRLYGYERIRTTPPATLHMAAVESDEVFWERRVREVLQGAGFSESYVYQFTGAKELAEFESNAADCLELANPVSPESAYLLPRPVMKYIRQAAENARFSDAVRLFGIAKSIRADASEPLGVREKKHLVLAFTVKGASGEDEFYELKGTVDGLLESLGIAEHWYDDAVVQKLRAGNPQIFHPYRFAEIKADDTKLGNIGEVHPVVLENIKAKNRIVVAEIDLEKLVEHASAEAEYHPASRFPAVMRDIAVRVPFAVKADDVLNVIDERGGGILQDVDLFDYFQDDKMKMCNEKSLAFHLIFQSAERTLSDAEADAVFGDIVKALEGRGWGVRK